MAKPTALRTATDPLMVQRTQEVSSLHPGTRNILLFSNRYAYVSVFKSVIRAVPQQKGPSLPAKG